MPMSEGGWAYKNTRSHHKNPHICPIFHFSTGFICRGVFCPSLSSQLVVRMGLDHPLTEHSRTWGPEARALAAQSQVLSGIKLDQLVRRLQRQTGQSREACWRFVIQHGLKGRVEYRRWTEEEIEEVREELVKHSVEEVAK